MDFITLITLLSLFYITSATLHTGCYNYFREKDGCIDGAADSRHRCSKTKQAPLASHVYKAPKSHHKRDAHHLNRRYDTTKPSFFLDSVKDSSKGNCGAYDTANELGVCVWSGGWFDKGKTSNCDKRIFLKRRNSKQPTIFAKIVDSCDFNLKTNDTGCFQIGLTLKTFLQLNPTDDENKNGSISNLLWGFDNTHGQSGQQAPV